MGFVIRKIKKYIADRKVNNLNISLNIAIINREANNLTIDISIIDADKKTDNTS